MYRLEPWPRIDDWKVCRPSESEAGMRDREFFYEVADRSGLSREEAADITRATLLTLADRISGGEARDLAVEVPEPLGQNLRSGDEAAKRYNLAEFERRVGEHAGLSPRETTRGVAAVLLTLRDATPDSAYQQAMSQLPKEFSPA
jgi:uncharacterized protein (DUF2267 family)